MIHSMTGYGRATVELPNKRVTVEIRSLNSKQFDLFTRLPILYREKEHLVTQRPLQKVGARESGPIDKRGGHR